MSTRNLLNRWAAADGDVSVVHERTGQPIESRIRHNVIVYLHLPWAACAFLWPITRAPRSDCARACSNAISSRNDSLIGPDWYLYHDIYRLPHATKNKTPAVRIRWSCDNGSNASNSQEIWFKMFYWQPGSGESGGRVSEVYLPFRLVHTLRAFHKHSVWFKGIDQSFLIYVYIKTHFAAVQVTTTYRNVDQPATWIAYVQCVPGTAIFAQTLVSGNVAASVCVCVAVNWFRNMCMTRSPCTRCTLHNYKLDECGACALLHLGIKSNCGGRAASTAFDVCGTSASLNTQNTDRQSQRGGICPLGASNSCKTCSIFTLAVGLCFAMQFFLTLSTPSLDFHAKTFASATSASNISNNSGSSIISQSMQIPSTLCTFTMVDFFAISAIEKSPPHHQSVRYQGPSSSNIRRRVHGK